MSSDASAKMDDCPTNFDDICEQNLLLPPVNRSSEGYVFNRICPLFCPQRGPI